MLVQMSEVRRDFIASHLRSQIKTLQGLLRMIEEEDLYGNGQGESFRKVETSIRHIRKLLTDN